MCLAQEETDRDVHKENVSTLAQTHITSRGSEDAPQSADTPAMLQSVEKDAMFLAAADNEQTVETEEPQASLPPPVLPFRASDRSSSNTRRRYVAPAQSPKSEKPTAISEATVSVAVSPSPVAVAVAALVPAVHQPSQSMLARAKQQLHRQQDLSLAEALGNLPSQRSISSSHQSDSPIPSSPTSVASTPTAGVDPVRVPPAPADSEPVQGAGPPAAALPMLPAPHADMVTITTIDPASSSATSSYGLRPQSRGRAAAASTRPPGQGRVSGAQTAAAAALYASLASQERQSAFANKMLPLIVDLIVHQPFWVSTVNDYMALHAAHAAGKSAAALTVQLAANQQALAEAENYAAKLVARVETLESQHKADMDRVHAQLSEAHACLQGYALTMLTLRRQLYGKVTCDRALALCARGLGPQAPMGMFLARSGITFKPGRCVCSLRVRSCFVSTPVRFRVFHAGLKRDEGEAESDTFLLHAASLPIEVSPEALSWPEVSRSLALVVEAQRARVAASLPPVPIESSSIGGGRVAAPLHCPPTQVNSPLASTCRVCCEL